MSVVQLAWARFGILASIFGDMQARVVASILYFTVVLPFGLIMQIGDHPFKHSGKPNNPGWVKREPVPTAMEDAQRQG
ncbi:MAG: hypothetical protein SF123_10030 [Chloroflexota bacterium]|nr:hypothetical protein [Chloroflexota bacterium]